MQHFKKSFADDFNMSKAPKMWFGARGQQAGMLYAICYFICNFIFREMYDAIICYNMLCIVPVVYIWFNFWGSLVKMRYTEHSFERVPALSVSLKFNE